MRLSWGYVWRTFSGKGPAVDLVCLIGGLAGTGGGVIGGVLKEEALEELEELEIEKGMGEGERVLFILSWISGDLPTLPFANSLLLF